MGAIWEEWQSMSCPECGTSVWPYGGFGEGVWSRVGKYGCYKGCGRVWYADPLSGEMYTRDPRGHLILVKRPEAG